ncbi:glycosyltransferase family 87 protein [Propionibacteriaceae bacterium Y1923]
MTPPPQEHRGRAGGEDWAVAALRWFSTTVPVVLVALVVAPLVIEGGTVVPWRPVMTELGTMIVVATQMIEGQVVFGTATTANFAWTPFGAILLVPLALSGPLLWQLGSIVATVSALVHLLRRLLGLDGRALLLAGVAVVIMVEPVRTTLGVGQISLLVVLLVVVDLMSPKAPPRRRLLPTGVLTGIAAGIALTPAWVLLALLLAGHRRVALTGLATAASCLLVGWIVMPGQSEGLLEFAGPDPVGALWASNQSLAGALARWHVAPILAGVLALVVAAAGAWAASRWWRDQPVLALGVVLLASLMPLNPAWTWQFVGVVVLGAGLLRDWDRLPKGLAVTAATWAVWTAVALPQLVASGSAVPGPWESALAAVGPLLGVAVIAVAGVAAPPRPALTRPVAARVVEKTPN